MTALNKQELRQTAEKAIGAFERLSTMPADEIFDISLHEGTQLDADITALNAFNELANPKTMLALLDENESMARDLISRNGEIEGLRQRAAELEAREQKNLAGERQRVIDGLCTIGETAWEIDEYMKEWDAKHLRKAASAGIGVKGE